MAIVDMDQIQLESQRQKINEVYQYNMIQKFKQQSLIEQQDHVETDPESDSDNDGHVHESEREEGSQFMHHEFQSEFESVLSSNQQVQKDIERFKPLI